MLDATVGQFLINDALPEELRDYTRVLDSKSLRSLLAQVARQYPEKYREVSFRLNQIGQRAAQDDGGMSFSLRHLKRSKAATEIRKKIQEKVRAVLADDSLSDQQRTDKITLIVGRESEAQQKAVLEEALKEKNPLGLQVLSGSRGKPMNLASLLASDMLYSDHRDEVIPVPVLRGYSEGLSPEEYWAGAYGARRGIIATKFATQEAGFLSKQLNQAGHRLVVMGEDREDAEDPEAPVRGLIVDTGDMDNEGSLLARDAGPYKKNTPLTPKIIKHLDRMGIKRILVRSPLVGGSPEGGVYARDVGIRERGTLPGRGEQVGLQAAQALSEPISQGQLSARHSGGVAGQEKAVGGFQYINQLIQIPKKMQGGAAHTTVDGTVQRVEPAPAGGHYVTIDDKQHYVGEGFEVKVKKGDYVEAGDLLSAGIPNPALITEYKGVGEGRRYFVNEFKKAMASSGMQGHRRNIELLARGLINHVKLTEETDEHVPDDVIPYSTLEHTYKPRDGHQRLPVAKAVGQYLERPVLHYTIGTKIRPSMLKDFEEFGVSEVPVHKNPPPFVPHMVRGMYQLQHDPDWMTQMYGSGLKKSLLNSVARGAVSETRGTSFVPSLATGLDFGEVPDRAVIKPLEGYPAPPVPIPDIPEFPGAEKTATRKFFDLKYKQAQTSFNTGNRSNTGSLGQSSSSGFNTGSGFDTGVSTPSLNSAIPTGLSLNNQQPNYNFTPAGNYQPAPVDLSGLSSGYTGYNSTSNYNPSESIINSTSSASLMPAPAANNPGINLAETPQVTYPQNSGFNRSAPPEINYAQNLNPVASGVSPPPVDPAQQAADFAQIRKNFATLGSRSGPTNRLTTSKSYSNPFAGVANQQTWLNTLFGGALGGLGGMGNGYMNGAPHGEGYAPAYDGEYESEYESAYYPNNTYSNQPANQTPENQEQTSSSGQHPFYTYMDLWAKAQGYGTPILDGILRGQTLSRAGNFAKSVNDAMRLGAENYTKGLGKLFDNIPGARHVSKVAPIPIPTSLAPPPKVPAKQTSKLFRWLGGKALAKVPVVGAGFEAAGVGLQVMEDGWDATTDATAQKWRDLVTGKRGWHTAYELPLAILSPVETTQMLMGAQTQMHQTAAEIAAPLIYDAVTNTDQQGRNAIKDQEASRELSSKLMLAPANEINQLKTINTPEAKARIAELEAEITRQNRKSNALTDETATWRVGKQNLFGYEGHKFRDAIANTMHENFRHWLALNEIPAEAQTPEQKAELSRLFRNIEEQKRLLEQYNREVGYFRTGMFDDTVRNVVSGRKREIADLLHKLDQPRPEDDPAEIIRQVNELKQDLETYRGWAAAAR
jgi:hypothetical protein